MIHERFVVVVVESDAFCNLFLT